MGIMRFSSICGLSLKPVVLTFFLMTLMYELFNIWLFFTDAALIEHFLDMAEHAISREHVRFHQTDKVNGEKVAKLIVTLMKCSIFYIIVTDMLDATTILFYLYGMWKKMPSLMIPSLVVNAVTLIFLTSAALGISVVLLIHEVNAISVFMIFFISMLALIISLFTNFLCPYNYYRHMKRALKDKMKYNSLEKF